MRKDGTSPDSSLEQLQLAWKNIGENLKEAGISYKDEAGMSYKDIVKLTIYMVEQIDPTERRSEQIN